MVVWNREVRLIKKIEIKRFEFKIALTLGSTHFIDAPTIVVHSIVAFKFLEVWILKRFEDARAIEILNL